MADKKTFSHIAVSSDDEDDFVIQAGARSQMPEPSFETEGVLESGPTQEMPAEEREDTSLEGAEVSQKKRDTYRETRLEDLESTPMSMAQKIIIALALVGVAAVAVYVIFLR